jgi:hypothetical protein
VRLLLALPLLLAACASPPAGGPAADGPASGPAADERRLARLSAEIDELIGVPRASSDARCLVLPVGRKACGGPREYRVYSADSRDAPRVRALAAEYTTLDSLRNVRLGLASNCALAEPPPVDRVGGVCVARR